MLKSVCVLFSLLFVASLASAEIFKYVGMERISIRIFPAGLNRWAGRQRMFQPRRNHPPKSSTKEITNLARGAAVGMTTDEVRAIWGERTDTVQEELGNGASRSSRTAPLDPCGLIVEDAWLPYSSRM